MKHDVKRVSRKFCLLMNVFAISSIHEICQATTLCAPPANHTDCKTITAEQQSRADKNKPRPKGPSEGSQAKNHHLNSSGLRCCCCCCSCRCTKAHATRLAKQRSTQKKHLCNKGMAATAPKKLPIIPYDMNALTQDEQAEIWSQLTTSTESVYPSDTESVDPSDPKTMGTHYATKDADNANHALQLADQGLVEQTFLLRPDAQKNLSAQLRAWCESQGWNLIWESTHDYPIHADLSVKGRLDQALELIVDAYHEAQFPLKLELYLNQRLVVISDF